MSTSACGASCAIRFSAGGGRRGAARRLTHPYLPATLAEYSAAIDQLNRSQPNAALLDGIRAHNHRVIDDLDSIQRLAGMFVLDIGASPHGYALEQALEHGASLYAGIGLHVARTLYVLAPSDGAGVLLEADAGDLLFRSEVFDLALSISTLEHLSDIDAVLAEIARVLKPGGRALLTFEPVWSCSYGHHLHHFGDCAKVIPPWAHLTRTPEEMRREVSGAWPADAPLSLDQAIEWIYTGTDINRLTIREVRERLDRCPLTVEWIVDLMEADVDHGAVEADVTLDRDVAGRAGHQGAQPDDEQGGMSDSTCWCGGEPPVPFGPGYARCPSCETLISLEMPGPEIARVTDEDRDFYGREYWLSHQQQELGLPDIHARARADLPERCLHWLRAALKYKLPPARVLEVGSGHGGFVAMLRWAGFDATGMEISPWVVDFARRTFGVPLLLGPVEDQRIEPASLDMIALMDVLEHLRDPVDTMSRCLDLLRPDGVLLIQTPSYPAGKGHEEMVALRDPFLETLQPREHLYLFTRDSVRELFSRLGADHVVFEPAFFAHYDMFLAVSRMPLREHAREDADRALTGSPSARMVQALLDVDRSLDDLKARHREAHADREARLAVIEQQGRELGEVVAARNNLAAEIAALRQHVGSLESDRAVHLGIIDDHTRLVHELAIARDHMTAERDRVAAARDHLVQEGRELRTEIETQELQIQLLGRHLRALQHLVSTVQRGRAYRLLRALGLWKWFDRAVAQAVDDR